MKLLMAPLEVEISVMSKSADALLSVKVRLTPELTEGVGLVIVTLGKLLSRM